MEKAVGLESLVYGQFCHWLTDWPLAIHGTSLTQILKLQNRILPLNLGLKECTLRLFSVFECCSPHPSICLCFSSVCTVIENLLSNFSTSRPLHFHFYIEILYQLKPPSLQILFFKIFPKASIQHHILKLTH